jgi:hypothetical protein
MMMPYENPDDYVSGFDYHPCPFHKIAPGESYPGCTCSGTYYRRKATPEEREANVKARREREARKVEALKAVGILGNCIN